MTRRGRGRPLVLEDELWKLILKQIRISFQYSSSNTSRRPRPRRVISTPLQIAGVLRGGQNPPAARCVGVV